MHKSMLTTKIQIDKISDTELLQIIIDRVNYAYKNLEKARISYAYLKQYNILIYDTLQQVYADIENCETIIQKYLKNSGIILKELPIDKLKHTSPDVAMAYSPIFNTILYTNKQNYISIQQYYLSMFHEITHGAVRNCNYLELISWLRALQNSTINVILFYNYIISTDEIISHLCSIILAKKTNILDNIMIDQTIVSILLEVMNLDDIKKYTKEEKEEIKNCLLDSLQNQIPIVEEIVSYIIRSEKSKKSLFSTMLEICKLDKKLLKRLFIVFLFTAKNALQCLLSKILKVSMFVFRVKLYD